MKRIFKAVINDMEDMLIIGGLVCIATATFLLSFVAGLYVAGAELLGLGIWFTVHPPGKE